MDPRLLIESYVDDIVRRLPRRQRGDVGPELRSLLGEELAARATAAGAPADEAMALALLSGFGRPEEVADRYRQGGLLIIKPSEATGFTWLALGGLGLQWALTLPAALARQAGSGGRPGSLGDIALHLERWWLGPGLGAFWWPGLLIVIAIVVAWVRQGRPAREAWTPPRVLDPDRVNRPLTAVGLSAWAAYMVFLAAAPTLVQRLPEPFATVFDFDDGFLSVRAPWLLPVWLCDFAAHVVAFVEGRWRRGTRLASRIAGLALCAVLGWYAAAGPIFRAGAADEITRGLLLVLAAFTIASLAVRIYRDTGEAPPHVRVRTGA